MTYCIIEAMKGTHTCNTCVHTTRVNFWLIKTNAYQDHNYYEFQRHNY